MRLAKGEALSEKDLKGLSDIAAKAKAAADTVEIRKKQLELENRQKAIESTIAEVKAKNEAGEKVDPAVKSIADRIIARLDLAAENSSKELKKLLFGQTNIAADPRILLHVAKIAAAKTAKKTIEFGQWAADMIKEFGPTVEPYLKLGWDQKDKHIDTEIEAGGGKKKKEVAAKIKAPKAALSDAAQQARIETAIANRIKEGKPLSSLAAYVNKLQESFIKQGIEGREPLIDAVHGVLKQHSDAITRDDAMEIMSKYGSDYATPLSKDPVKLTRRQVDGEIQQLLKLRDISNKVPLPKSGPERPTPGPAWRNLIKQVNAAKKKLGVVVTDPETQLKSSQDAIMTRMRNDIEDMTLELETGVKKPEQTPTEYTQEMEIMKGVRDRIRETLREIEGNPGLTDDQRLVMAKRAAEGSLAMWERRLAGETAKVRKGATSPEIEAIKARRDAVKAQVEEIDAADAVLQENRKMEGIVRQINAAEDALVVNAVRARTQGADTQMVAEARQQLAAVREALAAKNAADPLRQAEAIERAEKALEASIAKLDSELQAGNIGVQSKRSGLTSERLDYLRAQRDALNKLRTTLRNEAKPRLSPDQLAIKSFTARKLARAAELRRRMADGDFGPRTRKPPVDISGDQKALDAQADLMAIESDFQKMQEQWKLDQMNWVQRRWRNVGQAWDAGANMFLSMDLSTPLQTAFAMASHPIEGAKAMGKGATAFYQQFIRGSDAYAKREAAKLANSTNAKNGLYKAMKLELPSATGKAPEENMTSVLERLADLDAKWAGLPDVVKGLYKMEGRTLVKGGKRLASVIPKTVGSGIKASNAAFETIANTMRARTADAMLARWYGPNRGTPTKQQLELLGEQVNIMTGKGGLKTGDAVRRVFFAPNYYLSIIKQLSGYQLARSGIYHGERKVAKDIATEYVRAVATMGSLYGLAWLFGGTEDMQLDPKAKEFLKPRTEKGTRIDLTMGRGAWVTLGAQLAPEWMGGGRTYDKSGRSHETDRIGALTQFAKGRLSRGVSSSLTSAFGKDFRNRDISVGEVAKDFVIPLAWRDYDDVIKREGFTRGSFLQLLNILGVNYKITE